MARDSRPVQLGSIESFCKAAELGSFTAAASHLGLTPAAVSRSVGRLEARLGVRLFARTTRRIRLTDDGQAYYEECRQALAQIEAAERSIAGQQREPAGLLRLSVPTTYAHYRVLPMLPRFTERYPAVKVELHIANRNIDFVEEGHDLAIRLGQPRDATLVARLLEHASLGIFAAPDYLRRRGTPRSVAELAAHDCVAFVLPSTGRPVPWVLRDDGVDIDVHPDSRLRVLEDPLGCLGYARAGGGLVQMYHFIAEESVRRGELVELMQAHGGRSRPFSILYPRNRHLSARVRAFVDFLVQAVGSTPGLSAGN
ncbi:LysR family transcriptional regulator [Eleftheria terrae]|uniref:LysR family transcriptional regulator n=1 Tax=Eleftheria terrae TaxID=1597781 RepID=UPI00263BB17A|nr:LysR family transcriptional regulator [Eleftheria terrae]WKB54940.1 LysR substrate-binding domain-containing protein [Eleftheria terrae]